MKCEELQSLFEERFGRSPWLIGPGLTATWQFLESAAEVDLPVLLVGEPGTMRRDAARLLHLLGSRRQGPFIQGDSSSLTRAGFVADLYRWLECAGRGTLFLASLDELAPALQFRLAEMLELGLASRWQGANPGVPGVRLVASVAPGHQQEAGGSTALHRALEEELGFLVHELPPLRRRREDILPLVQYFLDFYGSGSELSRAAEKTLESFAWPGNVVQLRHVVGKLAAYCSDCHIDIQDLQAHTSELFDSQEPPGSCGVAAFEGRFDKVDLGESTHHPTVQRALGFLRERLSERITLAALASHCKVSQSHLSHLFKQHLGVSPVALLSRLRIEQATRLLVLDSETSITEIAGQVGFGDLRHFERTFKRLVGMAPRVYRHRAAREGAGGREARA